MRALPSLALSLLHPPTPSLHSLVYRLRILREDATLADLAEHRAAVTKALDSRTFDTSSAAEPRPNAYIPEEIGIPKPYGEFSPFKPSEPGSTMRHLRKPQPREIII